MDSNTLDFTIFCVANVADRLKMNARDVYHKLRQSGIINDYIIPCYDVLHTFSKQYITDDLVSLMKKEGAYLMITLYHASKVIVDKPDVFHSRESLDFGKGFYLTRLKSQAEKYAERFLRIGYSAFLNVYLLDDDLTGFTTHVFDKYDGEWLDYIVACRRLQSHTIYDIIEGGIANDRVYNTVDLYMQGIYTKEQALDQLIYKKPNNQICITSQKLMDAHLHFIKFIRLR